MNDLEISEIVTIILAIGALGTAAYGIVDGLKLFGIGSIGFGKISSFLGPNLMKSLESVYGKDCKQLLIAQYIKGRGQGDLVSTLRQGFKLGLPKLDLNQISNEFPEMDIEGLSGAADAVREGRDPEENEQIALARFDIVIDTKIEAAMALAESKYVNSIKLISAFVAVAISIFVSWKLSPLGDSSSSIIYGVIIGLLAIPISPVAKDLAKAVTAAKDAYKARG